MDREKPFSQREIERLQLEILNLKAICDRDAKTCNEQQAEIEKLKLLNVPLFSRRELEKDRTMLEWALKQGIYVSAHHTLNSRKSVAAAMKESA